MANNLHISYDLNNPGQNYDAVIEAIQGLGEWAKVHKSFWYVNSNYTAEAAAKIVWEKMDQNDMLYVVNSTNNTAYWYNLSDEVTRYIQERWYR